MGGEKFCGIVDGRNSTSQDGESKRCARRKESMMMTKQCGYAEIPICPRFTDLGEVTRDQARATIQDAVKRATRRAEAHVPMRPKPPKVDGTQTDGGMQ